MRTVRLLVVFMALVPASAFAFRGFFVGGDAKQKNVHWILLNVIFVCACIPHIVEDEPPIAEPCVVNQVDIESGELTHQFEFMDHKLLSWVRVWGSWNYVARHNFHDQKGVLMRATVTYHDTGELHEDGPKDSFREAVFKHDTRGNLLYVHTTHITEKPGRSRSWVKEVRYTYDSQNNKLTQDEVFTLGGSRSTVSNQYTYDGTNLTSIETDNADMRGKHWLSGYALSYDAKGQLIEVQYKVPDESSEVTRLEWDDHGQLISYGRSSPILWDEKGRLIQMTLLGATIGYDDLDRIGTVRYRMGHKKAGYDMHYSEQCPAGLKHQMFGPGIQNYLHLEGPRDLYTFQ